MTYVQVMHPLQAQWTVTPEMEFLRRYHHTATLDVLSTSDGLVVGAIDESDVLVHQFEISVSNSTGSRRGDIRRGKGKRHGMGFFFETWAAQSMSANQCSNH